MPDAETTLVPRAGLHPLLAGATDLAALDVDKLDKLMALQERWEAGQKRAAYATAMARAQARMPIVVKDKDNPHTRSRFASLENVLSLCKPVWTEEGFALTFGEAACPTPEWRRTTVRCLHKDGHFEDAYIDLPHDGKGAGGKASAMNAVQAVVSTNSYATRVLACQVFNIVIAGADQDGNQPGATLSADQIGVFNDLIERIRANKTKFAVVDFLGVFGITGEDIDIGMMRASDFWPGFRVLNKYIPATQEDEKLGRLDEARVRSYLESRRK